MISFKPTFRRLGIASDDLTEFASERWEIGAADTCFIRPAAFLDGQLDRIKDTIFLSQEQIVRAFTGGFDENEGPTYGYHLKNVDLVDGVLYGEKGIRHLRPRTRRLPAYIVPQEVETGAIYESWWGNRWFGNWLSDDCPRYLLAKAHGTPVTTSFVSTGHVPEYESKLGIEPKRLSRARFRELVIFEDFTKNEERRNRANEVRRRLVDDVPYTSHPGVFITRGTTGEARILSNEGEIAERFATERGFKIIDPTTSSLNDIVSACAGAKVVAGIEGSQLVHGLLAMSPGAILFAIQPPYRVTSVLKFFTDRQGMGYAFVIATGSPDSFEVDWDEIALTLDLALKQSDT